MTTFVGGGTGPATAAPTPPRARRGSRHIALMLQATTDTLPINIGLTGKGNWLRARRPWSIKSVRAQWV